MIYASILFCVAFLMVIRGATLATKYANRLTSSFRISSYTAGFLIISVISILPETFISINAALTGVPAFGLGTLLGSNVADLTLIFAILVLVSGRGMKIESKILKNHALYPLLLIVPLVLGFDGYFSRVEGVALILTGCIFYYLALRTEVKPNTTPTVTEHRGSDAVHLLLSMGLLLLGAHVIVSSATTLATGFGISPILIGMLIVGLGTTIPELFFSLKAVKRHKDSLAVGDILGTVLADATIVVGIIALIQPFVFPQKIIYVTGVFMVVAAAILFHFMRTGKTLTRKEGILLFLFWILFVVVEFLVTEFALIPI